MSLYFPSVYTTPTAYKSSPPIPSSQAPSLYGGIAALGGALGGTAGMTPLAVPSLPDAPDVYSETNRLGIPLPGTPGFPGPYVVNDPSADPNAYPLTFTPTGGGGGGSSAGGGGGSPGAFSLSMVGDYLSDPMLAQVKAYNLASIASAEARALEQRRQSLLGVGDVALGTSVLGSGDPTLGAISSDPATSLSVLARIQRNYQDTTHNANEALNQANLFYSGYRVKSLADLAHADQAQVFDATNKERNVLQGITDALLGVKDTARQREIQAISDAYNRALEIALANWQAAQMAAAAARGGGYGGGGGPEAPDPSNPKVAPAAASPTLDDLYAPMPSLGTYQQVIQDYGLTGAIGGVVGQPWNGGYAHL